MKTVVITGSAKEFGFEMAKVSTGVDTFFCEQFLGGLITNFDQ